ncbi:transporter substrate-binding domain-containing protein [Eubacteriales bacterium OttesenSCG-928-N14]|nr:transporter substrate-binding domain-containing protein [Eubacteriales bacterium OttesenSCG-928-N14]
MNRRLRRIQHILTGPIGIILLGIALLLVLLWIMSTVAEGSVDALPDIQERGMIYIGVRSDMPPYGSLDANGNPIGFEAELAEAIGRQIVGENGGVVLVPVTNKTRRAKLDYKDVDFLIAMVPDISANRSLFAIGDVYAREPIRIATMGGQTLDFNNSDATYNIGVVPDSVAHNQLKNMRKRAAVNYISIAGYEDAKSRLKQGQLDGICAETSYLMQLMDDQIGFTGDDLGNVAYAFCSRSNEGDLAGAIRDAYRQAKSDGRLAPIYEKYGLTMPS